ncbi:MAG: hypothetical protein HY922_00220 [Elusimicrobia bacterium]|nr:hypothetical protein [Elusimicrobiota bacterium]
MTKPGRRLFLSMLATAVSGAFLIGGYEFIRVAADSLFISVYGAAQRPYVMAASPLATVLFVYIFGRLLSRLGSLKTLVCTFTLALCAFSISFAYITLHARLGVILFYLFAQSYIVVLFEQYWSFIDSILQKEDAKAFNGPIMGIMSMGPITAGWLTAKAALSLGTKAIILLGAASLLPSLALAYCAYELAGEPRPSAEEKARKGTLQLSLFKEHPRLMLLALVIFLSQGLSSFVQLNFFITLEKALPLEDARTAFMGGFWMRTGIASAFFQFLAAPVLLKLSSLRAVMALIPCAHLLAGLSLFGSRSLTMTALAYGGFKVLDYSLFRAGKEILYIPFSFTVRYRAKQVIDALVYRFSKGLFSGLISVYGIALGAFPLAGYPLTQVVLSLSWLAAVFPLTSGLRDHSAR